MKETLQILGTIIGFLMILFIIPTAFRNIPPLSILLGLVPSVALIYIAYILRKIHKILSGNSST